MWLIWFDGELQALELGPPLLQGVLDLHPVHPVDRPRRLPAEVVLARDEGGHARGIVLVHRHLDLVDIGQAGEEVAGVPDEGETDIRTVAVEHPRPGADHRLGLLEVAELLHGLPRDDGQGHGIGHHVEEPDVGLLEGHLDRVLVHDLDLVEGRHHAAVGIALLAHEAIEGVLDVVGGELAPVHGRLGVPADALAELEDVRGLVGLGPGLGEITLEDEAARRHPRPRLVLEEPAVGEGVEDVGLVRDGQVRIEVRRIPQPERDRAAALRRLRERPAEARCAGPLPSRPEPPPTLRRSRRLSVRAHAASGPARPPGGGRRSRSSTFGA